MSFLICRFASARSRPEQIRDWIDYLGSLRSQHGSDPDRVRLIERLEAQAQRWLQAHPAGSRSDGETSPILAGFAGD